MQKDPFLPGSIGLVPDGTRRWAHQNQSSYSDAYIRTMLGITNFISFMFDQSIPSLSVYLLSKENLLRKPFDLEPVLTSEVNLLMKMLPPLVIRTGGEHRLSNFLPLQAGYAEYIFIDKYFNDLTEQDLLGFLNEFQIRHRRYGR